MNGRPVRQRGVALFFVLVMVLLGTLLAAWTARTVRFNELVTGNDADYQRALQAAQAMVRDAELDIRGQRPDGSPCRTAPGYEGSCRLTRLDAEAGQVFFPRDTGDFQDLSIALAGRTPSCIKGICLGAKLAPEFWRGQTAANGFEAMKKVAARYGEFTGATVADKGGDPLLMAGQDQAWYWVEVLPYDMGAAAADPFRPDAQRPFAYRITAVAQGRKQASLAVVQTVFIWRRVDS